MGLFWIKVMLIANKELKKRGLYLCRWVGAPKAGNSLHLLLPSRNKSCMQQIQSMPARPVPCVPGA